VPRDNYIRNLLGILGLIRGLDCTSDNRIRLGLTRERSRVVDLVASCLFRVLN
jgi:hypothetical protein